MLGLQSGYGVRVNPRYPTLRGCCRPAPTSTTRVNCGQTARGHMMSRVCAIETLVVRTRLSSRSLLPVGGGHRMVCGNESYLRPYVPFGARDLASASDNGSVCYGGHPEGLVELPGNRRGTLRGRRGMLRGRGHGRHIAYCAQSLLIRPAQLYLASAQTALMSPGTTAETRVAGIGLVYLDARDPLSSDHAPACCSEAGGQSAARGVRTGGYGSALPSMRRASCQSSPFPRPLTRRTSTSTSSPSSGIRSF